MRHTSPLHEAYLISAFFPLREAYFTSFATKKSTATSRKLKNEADSAKTLHLGKKSAN